LLKLEDSLRCQDSKRTEWIETKKEKYGEKEGDYLDDSNGTIILEFLEELEEICIPPTWI